MAYQKAWPLLANHLVRFHKICYAKGCQKHVPASEFHPILKTSRLDALIPCFTPARSHVGKYALAKLCLTGRSSATHLTQTGKGRKRRAQKLERRYLLHPIALHSRLKQWIRKVGLSCRPIFCRVPPLSSRDNRDRENGLDSPPLPTSRPARMRARISTSSRK